jgi:hypothetical protein
MKEKAFEMDTIVIDKDTYTIPSIVKIYIDSVEANRKIAIDELNRIKKGIKELGI